MELGGKSALIIFEDRKHQVGCGVGHGEEIPKPENKMCMTPECAISIWLDSPRRLHAYQTRVCMLAVRMFLGRMVRYRPLPSACHLVCKVL